MTRGVPAPIKNMSLVVKNIIKEAISTSEIAQDFNFQETIGKRVDEDRLNGHRFAKNVVLGLHDILASKLHNRGFRNIDLWSSLIDHGFNPVDAILLTINTPSMSWTRRETFVPELLCQTSSHQNRAPFDLSNVIPCVIEMDAVYGRLLTLKPIIYEKDECPEFVDPQARLFATLVTTDDVLISAAFSPLIQTCFDAWVDDLKAMSDARKMAGIVLLLNRFERLAGQHKNRSCHPDLIEPINTFFLRAMAKITELRVSVEIGNNHGFGGITHYKHVFDYLGLGLQERKDLIRAMALTGNPKLVACVAGALIKHPEAYAQALSESALDSITAHEVLRINLHNDVYSDAGAYFDISRADAFIERYRAAFKAVGYADLIGSKALDGLTACLDVGEHFERKGYLRREPMGMTNTFAYCVDACGQPAADSPQAKLYRLSVTHRKVDLAARLGQTQFLKDNFDVFFKGHHVLNSALATNDALKYVLETGVLLPSDILTTEARVKKAAAAGISPKVFAKGLKNKLTNAYKSELLFDDLGL
jgi:hypothetical protein